MDRGHSQECAQTRSQAEPCSSFADSSSSLGLAIVPARLHYYIISKANVAMPLPPLAQGSTNKVEPWYGVKFQQKAVPDEWHQCWQDASSGALHLPHLNPFIPTDFDMLQVAPCCAAPARSFSGGELLLLPSGSCAAGQPAVPPGWLWSLTSGLQYCCMHDSHIPVNEAGSAGSLQSERRVGQICLQGAQAEEPSIVLQTPLTCCWHRLNGSFDLPKAVVILLIQAPEAYASPEAVVLGKLLLAMLQEQLNEVAYDAELAGGWVPVHPGAPSTSVLPAAAAENDLL